MDRSHVGAVVALLVILTAADTSHGFFGLGGGKGLLDRDERATAEEILAGLESEVRAVFFNTTGKCRQCDDIADFVVELSGISGKFSHETLLFEEARGRAAELGVERAPAIVLLDGQGRNRGIRYYGLPLGYEYEAFLSAALHISRGSADLEEKTREGLRALAEPVTITVFVTRH